MEKITQIFIFLSLILIPFVLLHSNNLIFKNKSVNKKFTASINTKYFPLEKAFNDQLNEYMKKVYTHHIDITNNNILVVTHIVIYTDDVTDKDIGVKGYFDVISYDYSNLGKYKGPCISVINITLNLYKPISLTLPLDYIFNLVESKIKQQDRIYIVYISTGLYTFKNISEIDNTFK